jgi:UDP-N-acetylmuramoyl-L-alanyl-D-glutamate--2,6-diaminopimelate ligase
MKLKELLRDIPVLELHADPELELNDVCYDSRRVKPGSLFTAVRGYETDGHRYIPAAVKNGAGAVVCEEAPGEEIPWVLVGDSRKALARLSANLLGRPA